MRKWRSGALLLLAVLVCGCGTATARPTPPATVLIPDVTPSPTPQPGCADRVLAAMTMEQRVGQLFELGLADDRLGDTEIRLIREDHIGSVWFISRTSAGVSGIRAVASAVQSQVSSASTANVRFFIAANQEGGLIQALQGSGFSTIPSAAVQGAWAPDLLQQRALAWGQQLEAAGINLNFAPVMDVVAPGTDASNQPIGALQRGFGHDPATVTSHGVAFLTGMRQSGVAVTLKHFPGLGRVTGNTDFTTATDTTTTASDSSLQPFASGIEASADFVMVALAKYTRIDPDHLAAFSPIVLRDMLRGRMAFGGVIISDDLGATAAVSSIPPARRAIDFLSAGGDMIISKTPGPADAMVQAVRSRAASDAGFYARVNDAALRVLRAKAAFGLLPC